MPSAPTPTTDPGPDPLEIDPLNEPSDSSPHLPVQTDAGKRPVLDRFGGRFLYISVLVHVAFGLVATWYVVQRSEAKRKLTFQAGQQGRNQQAKALEHKIQVTKKRNSMSAPAPSKRITTTAASARVAIPDMPMSMPSSAVAAQTMAGAGGQGVSFGTATMGGGGAGGGVGGGAMPFFGLRTPSATAFAGTLIDLKQTQHGRPTPMTGDAATTNGDVNPAVDGPLKEVYFAEVTKLIKSSYSEGQTGKYFKSPNQLFTQQIFIPRMKAAKGPEEFGVADKVKPKRWIVHYTANVSPKHSGKYRFVGHGDDVLVVKFNGKVVLDGSLYDVTEGWTPNRVLNFQPFGTPKRPPTRATAEALAEGDSVEVTAGNSYPMEVTIGECPGGGFTAILLIEKEGEKYTEDKRGNPILPIFKLAPSKVTLANQGSAPVFAADTHWSVWKAQQGTSSGLDFFKH